MDIIKEILEKLSLEKCKWLELKEIRQDHDHFIEDVVLVLDWVMRDIEMIGENL